MLIILRGAAGIGAAVIFPVTLSIIVNVFRDRKQRSIAIGAWAATSGLGIGVGPIFGGLLVEHYWWGSSLMLAGGIAVAALLATTIFVPDSRDPSTPPVDVIGLTLSTFGLGTLVYTLIEAPEHGWSSGHTGIGFAVALMVLIAFVLQERRCPHPMLDVTLFTNLRFTAASAAVTVAFFAMFGFVFLIVQYFELMYGYGPLETGVRSLPVAATTAVSAVVGVILALRFGNKIVVAAGLISFAAAFTWISTIAIATSYSAIVGQMILLGLGLGFSTAPATEAIMGVVPTDKAGVGSAVNDATRELGGTLGVAVLGSIALSIYRGAFSDKGLGAAVTARAQQSVVSAFQYAGALARSGDSAGAARIARWTRAGFFDGLHVACLVAAGVTLAGALLVLCFLPAHPVQQPAGGGASVDLLNTSPAATSS